MVGAFFKISDFPNLHLLISGRVSVPPSAKTPHFPQNTNREMFPSFITIPLFDVFINQNKLSVEKGYRVIIYLGSIHAQHTNMLTDNSGSTTPVKMKTMAPVCMVDSNDDQGIVII